MLADVLALLGGACIVAGIAVLSFPAALIVAGVLLILGAWRLA